METEAKSIWVGTRKGTFRVTRTVAGWVPELVGHVGGGVNYVARDPYTGRLWALLGFGHWGAKLSFSDDDGATWSDSANPVVYPPGARFYAQDMYEDPDSDEGVGFSTVLRPATLAKLWVIAFGPGGRVALGTIPGGLFLSDDGGESFALNLPLWNHPSRGGDLFAGEGSGDTKWFGTPASEGGVFAPGIHSIWIDPQDPGHMLVAVSTAGVIETLDGGQSWRSRNAGMAMDHDPDPHAEWGHDPHFVQPCEGDPRHVWQQNHVGVFYSDDGASSWRCVSKPEQGVRFGFPIATDPKDGKVAWVVPGRGDHARIALESGLCVARTDDGGQSWRTLSEGLPQTQAYDVVYRHALDHRDDVVAFGSTTGNLYVSEDRGERWVAVAHNLPPIYSVRFG